MGAGARAGRQFALLAIALLGCSESAWARRVCRLSGGTQELQLPEIHRPSAPAQSELLGVYPYDLEITCAGPGATSGSEALALLIYMSNIVTEADYLLTGSGASIGYQLYERDRGLLINSTASRRYELARQPATSNQVIYRIPLDLRLVGTGRPLRPGTLHLGSLFRMEVLFPGPGDIGASQPATPFDHSAYVPVRTATCTMVTPPWVMDAADAQTLAVPGDHIGTKPFGVDLHCDADVELSMTLSDANDAANTGTALSADTSSTTQAIGFQVLRDGAPVRLQAAWPVSAPAGASQLSFQARYLRTDGELQPGEIHSKGTLTLTYR